MHHENAYIPSGAEQSTLVWWNTGYVCRLGMSNSQALVAFHPFNVFTSMYVSSLLCLQPQEEQITER